MEKMPFCSSEKKFGHCKINWTIENFCLQSSGTRWKIESPEFSISDPKKTSWSLLLRPHSNSKYFVRLSLRRSLVDSGPLLIWINLRLRFFSFEYTEFDLLFSLEKGTDYEIFPGKMRQPFPYTAVLESDKVIIDCRMIVYSSNIEKQFKSCSDEGIKLLSKDLLDLYISGKNFDTELSFNGNVIQAHKAVLCARNGMLCRMIEDETAQQVEFEEVLHLEFYGSLDYNGMKKILAYLYSGDINHVLEEPSLDIHDCARFLEITEIQDYYGSDVLMLISSVDLQQFTFIITDFAMVHENCYFSLDFDVADSFIKCRVRFYPKSQNNTDPIALYTETFENPVNACLELSLKDKQDQDIFATRILTPAIGHKSRICMGQYSKENTFKIIVNLKLTTGKKCSYIHNQSISCVYSDNENFCYEKLSQDMEDVFDASSFSDIRIYSNGVNFMVHKCVIESRSNFFSEVLKTLEDGEIIVISNIEPNILETALTYIYNGVLWELDDDDFIQTYKAAVALNLPLLKTMCSNKIKLCLKTNNTIACSVVKVTEEHGDKDLKECALKEIYNRKLLFPRNYPFSFRDVQTCSYCSF